MAQSTLSALLQANRTWGQDETEVEAIVLAIANIGVAPVNTTADPGSDATKVVAVQGVAGGQAVTVKPVQGAPTDRSGSITTGGASQTLAAAKASRVYIEIQNISDETMYINFGAAAVADSNSFKLIAGASYVNPSFFCPTGTITIISATTGKKFVAKEF